MATTKKSEPATTPTVNDNKTVFAPLGKYAVVAVVMVSIIVTTAIMLDKQLNTVEEKIAAIKTEVTEMHTIDSTTTDTATSNAPVEIVASTSETSTTIETKEITKIETAPAPVAKQEQVTEALVTTATPVTIQPTEQATNVDIVEAVATATPAQTRQTAFTIDNQTRIETYKLEQKQRMAEMFARIKSLESQQLDRYKTNQDGQIAHLRDEITSQQQIIENLVLRNKELFEMRAANALRNQTNREQVLNRI